MSAGPTPSERELMLAGEPYDPLDEELVEGRARARALTLAYNATLGDEIERRSELLESLLGAAAEGVWVEPPFHCDYGSNIYLGENVFLNLGCVILDCARIEIGQNSLLGPCVQIYAATHPADPVARREGVEFARPVTLEADVWIGGASVVCPGVTIGAGTTVGAGSVVVSDLPPGVVAGGNPCRVIRRLEEPEPQAPG
jgi:maltose O-acetyltransferase